MTNLTTQTIQHDEIDFMEMYVKATTDVNMEDLYPGDVEALGTVSVYVPRHLPLRIAAATALGAFHNTMPIKYTGDFEFTVYDEEGEEVEPTYDHNITVLAKRHGAFVSR